MQNLWVLVLKNLAAKILGKDHVENAGLTAYLFEVNTEKSIDCKDVNESMKKLPFMWF